MEKIIKLNTVKDYNDFLGIDTPHPLVGVIDASKIKPLHHIRKSIGFYVIYLKDTSWSKYDKVVGFYRYLIKIDRSFYLSGCAKYKNFAFQAYRIVSVQSQ